MEILGCVLKRVPMCEYRVYEIKSLLLAELKTVNMKNVNTLSFEAK